MSSAGETQGSTSELVHCYRLIFQVDPGGSRKAESFVAGTLAEAQAAALADLGSGEGAYHALFYGEEIVLQCWEGAKKVASIELHPFITYRVPGVEGAIRFEDGDEPPLSMDDEELTERVMADQGEIAVTIDWEAMALPQMAGRPVRAGETVKLERGRAWAHGFHGHWDAKIKWRDR